MKLTSIRLQNFRAFRDTESIQVKPITILVGRNSIGKSSFARVWSLFRQSVSERKRGPVLWYGKHVDFGSFQDAKCRSADSDTITFSLQLSDLAPGATQRSQRDGSRNRHVFAQIECCALEIDLAYHQADQQTYCKQLRIDLAGTQLSVEYSSPNKIERIQCAGLSVTIPRNIATVVSTGSLLPFHHYFTKIMHDGADRFVPTKPPHTQLLHSHLKSILHGRFNDESIALIANSLPLTASDELHAALCRLPYTQSSWKAYCQKIKTNSSAASDLLARIVIFRLDEIIGALDTSLDRYFSGVRYIEPIRASAERYYRQQELSVSEMDSRGANLAVYLDSLKPYQRRELNEWLRDRLGFEIQTERSGGHLVVRIRDSETDRLDNMADMGFGFSQMLPIAVQTWASSAGSGTGVSRSRDTCLVLEQPELHLHPAMQARVGQMLVRSSIEARKTGRAIDLVVETHSSHLIGRIGDMISEGECDPNDVQVILFEQKSGNSVTDLRVAKFDQTGRLMNWPFGFLEADWYSK